MKTSYRDEIRIIARRELQNSSFYNSIKNMLNGSSFVKNAREATHAASSDAIDENGSAWTAIKQWIEDLKNQCLSWFLRKDVEDTAAKKITFSEGWQSDGDTSTTGSSTVSGNSSTGGNSTVKGKSVVGDTETVQGEVVTHDKMRNNTFRKGYLDGKGFGLYTDDNNRSTLEVDKLYVRYKGVFAQLEIRKLSYVGGDQAFSFAGSELVKVVPLDSSGSEITDDTTPTAYKCYYQNDDGTTRTQNWWHVGDMARCQDFPIQEGVSKDVSNRYYWRLVTAVGEEDVETTATETITTTSEDGETTTSTQEVTTTRHLGYVVLSNNADGFTIVDPDDSTKNLQDSDGNDIVFIGYDASVDNDAPAAEDKIVQLGNQYDTERMYAYIIFVTEQKRVDYAGINNYNLADHAVAQYSPKGSFVYTNLFEMRVGSPSAYTPLTKYRGDWSDSVEYSYYDTVTYDNRLWIMSSQGTTSTGDTPSDDSEVWKAVISVKDGADAVTYEIVPSNMAPNTTNGAVDVTFSFYKVQGTTRTLCSDQYKYKAFHNGNFTDMNDKGGKVTYSVSGTSAFMVRLCSYDQRTIYQEITIQPYQAKDGADGADGKDGADGTSFKVNGKAVGYYNAMAKSINYSSISGYMSYIGYTPQSGDLCLVLSGGGVDGSMLYSAGIQKYDGSAWADAGITLTEGDGYIIQNDKDSNNGHVFTCSESAGWVDLGSIKGVDGADGNDGADGQDGADAVTLVCNPDAMVWNQNDDGTWAATDASGNTISKIITANIYAGSTLNNDGWTFGFAFTSVSENSEMRSSNSCTLSEPLQSGTKDVTNADGTTTTVKTYPGEASVKITATNGTVTLEKDVQILLNALGSWRLTVKGDVMTAVSEKTESQFTELGNQITTLESEIRQQADEISLRVTEDELKSAGITIQSDGVTIDGAKTTIDGDLQVDGTFWGVLRRHALTITSENQSQYITEDVDVFGNYTAVMDLTKTGSFVVVDSSVTLQHTTEITLHMPCLPDPDYMSSDGTNDYSSYDGGFAAYAAYARTFIGMRFALYNNSQYAVYFDTMVSQIRWQSAGDGLSRLMLPPTTDFEVAGGEWASLECVPGRVQIATGNGTSSTNPTSDTTTPNYEERIYWEVRTGYQAREDSTFLSGVSIG